jgi:hypothetical protein
MNTPRFVSITAAIAAASMFAAPGSAAGFTATGSGAWGGWRMPFVQGATYPFALPQIQFPSRTVYRSSGHSGTQRITATYGVFQWQGASRTWSRTTSYTGTITVRAGQRAIFAPRAFQVLYPHHYTVVISTYWRRLSGRLIGTRHVSYVHASDYRCYGPGVCAIQFIGGRASLFFDSGYASTPT